MQHDTNASQPTVSTAATSDSPKKITARPSIGRKSIKSDKRLYSEKETAHYLSVSRSYLRQDRMNGKFKHRSPGSAYCRFGTMIRYDKAELDRWIESNFIARQ